jgi:hypothetical protein
MRGLRAVTVEQTLAIECDAAGVRQLISEVPKSGAIAAAFLPGARGRAP